LLLIDRIPAFAQVRGLGVALEVVGEDDSRIVGDSRVAGVLAGNAVVAADRALVAMISAETLPVVSGGTDR
jgi:hypothetical protein